MGKVKPNKPSRDSPKDGQRVSLTTIVKPKDKLKTSPVVQVKIKDSGDFPKRPAPTALKRKQRAKKQQRTDDGAGPAAVPKVHQKKHVKLAEKKQKLAQKFELMLKEQKEEQRQKKVERANKKIGSVATLGAIKDALPSLDSLLKFKGADLKTGVPEYDSIKVGKGKQKQQPGSGKKKNKGKPSDNKFTLKEKRITKQSKENTQRYDHLHKLMNDATFRKNPRQVIAEHIQNTKRDAAAAEENQ